ncbi:hypothetical protein V6Z11_D08G186800 [Gossypium hirsutum]
MWRKKRELDTWPNQGDMKDTLHDEGAEGLGSLCDTVGGARTVISDGYTRASRDHIAGSHPRSCFLFSLS